MTIPIKFLEPTHERDRLPGQGYWNVGFDRIGNVPPDIPNLEEVLAQTYTSQLLAWDPVKQQARWASEVGPVAGGGVLSTAGNLVFHGSNDVRLLALDAATGDELWDYDTQSAAAAAPITYAIDGEQYVAVAVGFGGGGASEAGAILHGMNLRNLSRVLVFKLGARTELPPIPEQDKTLPKPAPVVASADVIEQGKVLYHRHCSYCHGDAMRTGGLTPDLRYASSSVHDIWKGIVLEGALKARGMVSFAPFISETEAEGIRQYVLVEANKLYERQQSSSSAE